MQTVVLGETWFFQINFLIQQLVRIVLQIAINL